MPDERVVTPAPEAAAPEVPTLALSAEGLDPRLPGVVAGLVAERGGQPLSFDEFRELVDAGDQEKRAYGGQDEDPGDQQGLLRRALRIPHTAVALYTPTIAAEIRLQELQRWLRERRVEPHWHWRCLAYILAHGYDEAALARVACLPEARLAVDEWAVRLTCTDQDIDDAVRRLVRGTLPPADQGPEDGAEGHGRPFAGAGPGGSTGPGSSPTWSSTPAAQPATGCTTSPSPTPSG